MSAATFDLDAAFILLKARLDRGGLPIPPAQEEEWRMILDASVAELAGKGIMLNNTPEDMWLAAEVAAQKLQRRDAIGGYTEELRRAIRQRFLREGLKRDAE